MRFKELIKPTKKKIFSFIIFLVGLFLLKIVYYIIRIKIARNYGVDYYGYFFKTYGWAFSAFSILWAYAVICFIFFMVNKNQFSLKPTKQKMKIFALYLLLIILSKIWGFFISNLSPEKAMELVTGWSASVALMASGLFSLLWIYVLACLIPQISRNKLR